MNWMQRAVARRHENEEGMTLIELLIVVLILGVLATIVVLGIGAFQDTGKSQACVTTGRSLESAAAAYYSKNPGNYGDVTAYQGAGLIKNFSNPWGLPTSPNADGTWNTSVC
jgi:prepilin-type N-terminal cleavage/methylation domain-containing protein